MGSGALDISDVLLSIP